MRVRVAWAVSGGADLSSSWVSPIWPPVKERTGMVAGDRSGQNGSHFEPKPVPPPLTNKCDWEIGPSELDFSTLAMIGKGAFGEILKACWRGTPVAVKRILPSLSDDRLGDLHQYLKEKGSLGPSTAINFALDIARAMAYLHNEPNVIIHRDLKPRTEDEVNG
ncbi:hypothetical protein CMV_025226 [Castanea mollissima]|uniref:Protein kinase domain-containing protein n=1 Tax=Castanea mollissima TaxID=60419 RepID=A0A8J4QGG7_9ROSI|nr:hypothetical protein CMV_025226 [Castanea mollissima]